MTIRNAKGLVAAFALTLLVAPAALATNGMYMTAYGPETLGRGGVNLAISDRSLALNFNPAGIGQLQGQHFSVSVGALMPSLEFSNMINEPTKSESAIFPLPSIAYVRASKDSPWAWGVGFISQGGMGAQFENLNTFFMTQDETFSEVRFGTLSPTVAYNFSDNFSLGLTANLGYADASFRFFPQTSFFNQQAPEFSFFGLDMKRASGLQTSARVGLWWRPAPRFTVGAIYQTKTNSTFDGGDMTVNFEGHPMLQQRVSYDATMDGFTFAAQAGVGFAYRAGERWVLGLDIKRYFWDDAIDTITVTAKDPSVQGAPPEVVVPFVFDWKDQWVYAFGFDYRATDRWTLRAGYNHGDNPVPDDTLTPLFPAIVEDHLSFGFSFLEKNRTWEFAVEHAFKAEQTNNNPNPMVNPFGPGATVSHEQWTLAFGVSWAWDR